MTNKTRAVVDRSLCIGCSSCEAVCPVDAIHVDENNLAWADENCISCGACCAVCPVACISIESIEEWYEKQKQFFKEQKK